MSNKKMNSSQDISDSVVQEVLLDNKPSGKRNKKKVTTSSPLESGSDSPGIGRKVISTPP